MRWIPGLLLLAGMAGCGSGQPIPAPERAAATEATAQPVLDTMVTATFDAAGVAQPVLHSTLSTKLMGSVVRVQVQEGDRVAAGQVLAQVDARELDAKRSQVEAGLSAARAVYEDALTQAGRFRALYADSAATRYQLDQVETGLARAEAGLRSAEAAERELGAVASYAEVRAPFAGVITRRYVDPGAFVAPGAPLLEVQDSRRLRISVTAPPTVAARLRRGDAVRATVEGQAGEAEIEGVVPAAGGGVYTVNALIANPRGMLLTGGSATLRIPTGTRRALLVPVSALVREGDLTGVRVSGAAGPELRWLRLGDTLAAEPGGAEAGAVRPDLVEVLSGLAAGDRVLLGGM